MKIWEILDGIGEVVVSSVEKVYWAIPKRGKKERDERIEGVKEELSELKGMEEEEVEGGPFVVKEEETEEEISEEELEEKIRIDEDIEREFKEEKKERRREEEKMREKISDIGRGHVVVDVGEGTEEKRILRRDLRGSFLNRFKKFIKLKKPKK